MKKVLTNILLLICLGVFVFSAYQLVDYFWARKQADDEYEDLTSSVEINKKGKKKINFNKLRKINPEVIGWVYAKGTKINYPIVKAKTNSKYLHHTFKGKRNASGAIFMDKHGKADFTAQHNIIYGHHMRNGSMFASLLKFRDQKFLKKHHTIMIYTPDRTMTLHVFSAYARRAYLTRIPITFGDQKQMKEYISDIISRSDIAPAKKTDTKDIQRIFTFVTCSYERNDNRTFVHAREVKVEYNK